MSKIGGALFGKKQKVNVPGSGFYALPGFARSGLEESVESARGFLKDPAAFMAAPATADQESALEILRQGIEPLTQEGFKERLGVFQNPYVQQTLAPALADLQRLGTGSFGDIGQQATQAGAFGSARQALREAELGRSLAQEAGRLSANVRSAAYESAADRALGQLAREQAGAAALFDAGENLRQIEQQNIFAPVAATRFLSDIVSRVPQGQAPQTVSLGRSGGLLGGGGIGSSLLSSGLSSLGGFGGFGQAIGSVFSPSPVGPYLPYGYSDERLKEDIKLVRKEGEYNIYQFRYIGKPKVYEGVIAQEVEKINPNAVKEFDGYLAVNYEMIDPEFKEVA